METSYNKHTVHSFGYPEVCVTLMTQFHETAQRYGQHFSVNTAKNMISLCCESQPLLRYYGATAIAFAAAFLQYRADLPKEAPLMRTQFFKMATDSNVTKPGIVIESLLETYLCLTRVRK